MSWGWNANVTPETARDEPLHTRFSAVEQGIRALFERIARVQAMIPDAPVVDWTAGTSGTTDPGGGGGGGGGSTTTVENGTIDGQVLRWNDADQVWEPAANVLIDTNGDITIDATALITSQANAAAFSVREQSGGQGQPVAVFQKTGGFASIRITPSANLIQTAPESTGAGFYISEGIASVASVQGRRSQGTRSSPTPPVSGNRLLSLQGVGWDGSGFEATPPGAVEIAATETHSSTAWGTRVSVKTTPNGTTAPAEALGVEENGDVTTPGKIRATDGLGVGNSASASAMGTIVAAIEVFDAAGASLGFLPVYDSFS